MSDDRKLYRVKVTHIGYVLADDEIDACQLAEDITADFSAVSQDEAQEVEPGSKIEWCEWEPDREVFCFGDEKPTLRDAWPKDPDTD